MDFLWNFFQTIFYPNKTTNYSSSRYLTNLILSSHLDDGDARIKHAKLSLQDIVQGRDLLDNHLFDGRWITNTELVYKTADGNVISYNAFNNNTQLLVSNITMVSKICIILARL